MTVTKITHNKNTLHNLIINNINQNAIKLIINLNIVAENIRGHCHQYNRKIVIVENRLIN